MVDREIYFKASRKASRSYNAYRQILKRGNLELDLAGISDDVIWVQGKDIGSEGIRIDCDKKTGEFRLFF